MAYINQRRLYWDAPDPSSVTIEVYAGDPDDSSFLANVDSRIFEPLAELPGDATEYYISMPEGEYQFAAVSGDAAGNFSDPYQHPGWVRVPLDVTPPASLTGGGID